MLSRIHMDPDPSGNASGGNAANPGQAQANPATPPAAPAPQPSAPGQTQPPANQTPPHGVMLTIEQYNELLAAQARDREAQAARATQAEQERQAEIERARRNNDAAEALRLQEANHQRALEAERTARLTAEQSAVIAARRELDATARMAVAAALATREFINDAARSQAEALLFHHVEAVRDGDVIQVRQRGTELPAAEYLNQALSGPEYAHFLRSRNNPAQVPNPTQAGRPAVPGGTPAPPHPSPLIDALFQTTRSSMNVQTGEAVGLSGHSRIPGQN